MAKVTPVESVNSSIEDVLETLRESFRLSSVYLLGSYVDGTFVTASDIDLCVLPEAREDVEALKKLVDGYSPVNDHPLDFTVIDKDSFLSEGLYLRDNLLWRESVLNVLLSGQLLYGEDVRARIDLPPRDVYTRYTVPIPLEFIGRVRGRPAAGIQGPVPYPRQDDYYYGYLEQSGNLKPIVSVVGWIATALIALADGTMVGKKSSVVERYKLAVNDGWAAFVEAVFRLCRTELNYAAPSGEADKELLRSLCGRLLSFENHYLRIYFSL